MNLNAILKARYYEAAFTLPASLQFLDAYSDTTLINLKWVFTAAFSLVYLAVALLTVRVLFNKKKYSYITIGLYVLITVISAVFIVIGYLATGISDKMYEFARYLMGMAQSPVLLMILIPAFKLSGQEKTEIEN